MAVAGLAGAVVLIGEVDDSAAEPGRSGRSLPTACALFRAAIVSLMEGRVETALVLLEKVDFPLEGPVEDAAGGLGFVGCLISMS